MIEHVKLHGKKVKKQLLGNCKSDAVMKLAVHLLPCRTEGLEKKSVNNIRLPRSQMPGSGWADYREGWEARIALHAFSLHPQHNPKNTVISSTLQKK